MNTKVELKEKTGRTKLFETGFNKKIIAAGPFYPLFRADNKWSLIIAAADIVVMYAISLIPVLSNLSLLKMIVGYIITNTVFAGIYSKKALTEALLNGFIPYTEEDQKTLEELSIVITKADEEAYKNKLEAKKKKAEQKKADKAAKKAEKAKQKEEARKAKAEAKAQKEAAEKANEEISAEEDKKDINDEDLKEINVDEEIDAPIEEVEESEEVNIIENDITNEEEKDLY